MTFRFVGCSLFCARSDLVTQNNPKRACFLYSLFIAPTKYKDRAYPHLLLGHSVMQVSSALKYLNEIKPPVIHYDLKPGKKTGKH